MMLSGNSTVGTLAARIAVCYGLVPDSVLPAQKGYRNQSFPVRLRDGQIANVLFYKSEPEIVSTIKNANFVSDFLAAHDFPARRSINPRIIRLQSSTKISYVAAYNYLPGHTIAWEAYTQKHIKLLGKTMSDMHAALQYLDATDLPDVTDTCLQIVARMRRYFYLPGVKHAMLAKLRLRANETIFDELEDVLQACKKLNQQQALHMDFVRSNILFIETADGPEISGILDFEKTARGNPLFDIARTLAFLLVDCKYKSAEKVCKYFLFSGYEKRGDAALPRITIQNVQGESKLLEMLVDLFLTYDFYKFLKHNPYESLEQNEHFIRTRDLLLERDSGCIAKITPR